MEKRKQNIIFNKSGAGNISYKISLPTTWVNDLKVKKDDREVNIYKLTDRIIIMKGEIEMKKLLNLSNHNMTQEQISELEQIGYQVVQLQDEDKQMWGQLNPQDYKAVCDEILDKYQADAYHLAGFPAAVVYITKVTTKPCYYAYSVRKSEETVQEDGTVVKKNIFKHQGFYLY